MRRFAAIAFVAIVSAAPIGTGFADTNTTAKLAPTQAVSVGPVATVKRKCARRFTVGQYERYARRHFHRGRIARVDYPYLTALYRCQDGRRSRHLVRRFRRELVVEQLDPCSNRNVMACIREAAAFYRQPLTDAIRVARCESGFDPHNSYTGHLGLFQFLYPGTWNTTPYRDHDVYSAKWNALAAMWM